MEDTKTVSQPERERLNPFVLPETARLVKVHAAMRGLTQGELIDDLAKQHLAAVTVSAPLADDTPAAPAA